MKLVQELRLIDLLALSDDNIAKLFEKKLSEGKLIMDENPQEHICVYTLPFHNQSKQVLLGHHIKADKWLVPGGHIDTGEIIVDTAVREIQEEMGIPVIQTAISSPFYAEITDITNSKPPRYCTKHYSIWVSFASPSNSLVLDPSEFHESSWFSIDEAIQKTTDKGNKDALRKFALSLDP